MRVSQHERENSVNSQIENAAAGLSEWRIAMCGLIISLSVITGKLYCMNRDYIYHLLYEDRLVKYEVITESGQVMFRNMWTTSLRHSGLWLPLLCGFLATYFTWIFVYLDSNVPGVQPPSPLSPRKYKLQSGHSFHLSYLFSVMVGVLITLYMYLNGVSLQY